MPVVQRGGEVHVPGSAELPLRPAAPEAAGRPPVPGVRAQGPGEQLWAQAQGEAARQGREMSFRIGCFRGSRLGRATRLVAVINMIV